MVLHHCVSTRSVGSSQIGFSDSALIAARAARPPERLSAVQRIASRRPAPRNATAASEAAGRASQVGTVQRAGPAGSVGIGRPALRPRSVAARTGAETVRDPCAAKIVAASGKSDPRGRPDLVGHDGRWRKARA